MAHPLVNDVGVIGVPDSERGSVVKAFVVLSSEMTEKSGVSDELKAHVKNSLGPHKQPRIVEIVKKLPRTRTGKISRAALRDIDRVGTESRAARYFDTDSNKGISTK